MSRYIRRGKSSGKSHHSRSSHKQSSVGRHRHSMSRRSSKKVWRKGNKTHKNNLTKHTQVERGGAKL